MASPYALPSTAIPHAHQQHIRPQSQSQSSLHAWRSSMSSGTLPTQVDEALGRTESHSHGHRPDYSSHSLSKSHSHARTGSHASNTSAVLQREKLPQSLDSLEGWTQETTAGGRSIITPGYDADNSPYSPPVKLERGHHSRPSQSSYISNHSHNHSHDHYHEHAATDFKAERSLFTRMLLQYSAPVPILHAILVEKDSRRIFYFMTLNFGFMVVQAFYGYLTDSLGLLSDSIHMFFDCVALFVGLLAAVMSKWPPSQRFPYGFGKIETLSGFANGILLMLLSVEIAFEAFERLWEGTKTKRLGELFIVSSLGLAVNLVGMMAFGHHHHGPGHDHSHSHSHSHSHDGHDQGRDHHHSHGGSAHENSHSHSHGHDNDNMHGIYLHVLADTLGSVSVIVSTALTSVWGWSGWDPLASFFIAVLIFLSSKPLVVSSAKRLLLSVPESTEYTLRNTLGDILQQRGIVSYWAPKFWLDDRTGSSSGEMLVGVVHIAVARGVALDDARQRVSDFLRSRGVDAVVQAERDGDTSCWCNRGRSSVTPTPKLS